MIKSKPASKRRRRIEPVAVLLFLLLCGLLALLAGIVCSLPLPGPTLQPEVAHHLHRSGVASPVTAVLLNFRGYDTLLEVMVLFLAIIGTWSLRKATFPSRPAETSPVQSAMVRLLTPLMGLVAAYLVWQGSHLAGGAFQGGAVLAAAIVLLLVADPPWLRAVPARFLRIGLTLGPALFFCIAVGCLVWGDGFLAYPEQTASSLLLLIESACAISIGLTLAGLFAGGRPLDDLEPEQPVGESSSLNREG